MQSCGTYSGYTIHIRDKTKPCDPCRLAANEYRRNKRSADNAKLGYDPRRFKRHNLSKNDYDLMLNKYNGKCWICKSAEAKHIDHDHKCCPTSHSCGKCVRGVLCQHCNTALGQLKDDENLLQSAIDYIKTFK